MIRVECHHSGGLIWSATVEEEAPRFACTLHTGLKRPAGKASLNSLEQIETMTCKRIKLRTLQPSDQGDSEHQR